jgi:hypothetical protein
MSGRSHFGMSCRTPLLYQLHSLLEVLSLFPSAHVADPGFRDPRPKCESVAQSQPKRQQANFLFPTVTSVMPKWKCTEFCLKPLCRGPAYK